MRMYNDGSVLFTRDEYLSLTKLVVACQDAIGGLSDDGDFLGWDNYRALDMWVDVLAGQAALDLDDYVGEEEKGSATTVEEWLAAYGQPKKKQKAR